MTTTVRPLTDEDRQSYPYKFGALAQQARLFLLGLMPRDEFVRAVNAANDDCPPIPLEERKRAPLCNCMVAAEGRVCDCHEEPARAALAKASGVEEERR